MKKSQSFSQGDKSKINTTDFHNNFLHIPQALWKKLQTGIYIGCDIPNMILQVGIAGGKRLFHLLNGIENSGVILVQLFTNIRSGKVGELSDKINGYLPGFRGSLVFQCTPQDRFVDGVELTDLCDDQVGCRKGITLGLEHIGNCP
jgi:hypothetical protein